MTRRALHLYDAVRVKDGEWAGREGLVVMLHADGDAGEVEIYDAAGACETVATLGWDDVEVKE